MAFKSESQRKLFYAKKARGEISQETIDEWEKDTPKEIPERLKKEAAAFGTYSNAFQNNFPTADLKQFLRNKAEGQAQGLIKDEIYSDDKPHQRLSKVPVPKWVVSYYMRALERKKEELADDLKLAPRQPSAPAQPEVPTTMLRSKLR